MAKTKGSGAELIPLLRILAEQLCGEGRALASQLVNDTAALLAAPAVPAEPPSFDFAAHLQRQREFSERTFGPGPRTKGVCDHIRKELAEIEQAPTDLSEWADVVILGLDGFWRSGATPEQIIAALVAKQTKNEARTWPDWRTQPKDRAIEHDRSQEAVPAERGAAQPWTQGWRPMETCEDGALVLMLTKHGAIEGYWNKSEGTGHAYFWQYIGDFYSQGWLPVPPPLAATLPPSPE